MAGSCSAGGQTPCPHASGLPSPVEHLCALPKECPASACIPADWAWGPGLVLTGTALLSWPRLRARSSPGPHLTRVLVALCSSLCAAQACSWFPVTLSAVLVSTAAAQGCLAEQWWLSQKGTSRQPQGLREHLSIPQPGVPAVVCPPATDPVLHLGPQLGGAGPSPSPRAGQSCPHCLVSGPWCSLRRGYAELSAQSLAAPWAGLRGMVDGTSQCNIANVISQGRVL